MDTEPINIHNEYLLKRCINIMKVYKFEKLIIEHILTPSTILEALYELFFLSS